MKWPTFLVVMVIFITGCRKPAPRAPSPVDPPGGVKDTGQIPPPTTALKDKDVRINEIIALAKSGEAAVDPLIVALKDKATVVRSKAAYALGKIVGRPRTRLLRMIRTALTDVTVLRLRSSDGHPDCRQ